MHLKVIQEMAKVPRSLGDTSFGEVVLPTASNASSSSLVTTSNIPLPPMGDNDARINPLAGLGLSDEQYVEILQNMVGNDSFGADDGSLRGASITQVEDEMVGVNEVGVLGKRGLAEEVGREMGREEKRRRFQVIE